MQLVIGDLLRQSALKFPRRLSITGEEVNFTYEELNGRVNRLTNGLLSGGLKKGDKPGVLLMNCYQFVELIMACAGSSRSRTGRTGRRGYRQDRTDGRTPA